MEKYYTYPQTQMCEQGWPVLPAEVGKEDNEVARRYSKINCYRALSHHHEVFFLGT